MLKSKNNAKIASKISTRNPEKASTAKTSENPPPGNKSLGIDPAIRLYEIKDGDKNEEGEEA